MNDYLLWIDVETSGLTPNTSQLLEVAGVITDQNLNIINETFFEEVIYHTPEETINLYETASSIVKDMHTKTGLWEKLSTGTPLKTVDETLQNIIKQAKTEHNIKTLRVAGNSVRLDLNFIETYLPATYSELTYRFIDVTTVNTLAQWWGKISAPQKKTTHSAMSDIMESIEELRFLKTRINFQ